jgi:hypothetical protein
MRNPEDVNAEDAVPPEESDYREMPKYMRLIRTSLLVFSALVFSAVRLMAHSLSTPDEMWIFRTFGAVITGNRRRKTL